MALPANSEPLGAQGWEPNMLSPARRPPEGHGEGHLF